MNRRERIRRKSDCESRAKLYRRIYVESRRAGDINKKNTYYKKYVDMLKKAKEYDV